MRALATALLLLQSVAVAQTPPRAAPEVFVRDIVNHSVSRESLASHACARPDVANCTPSIDVVTVPLVRTLTSSGDLARVEVSCATVARIGSSETGIEVGVGFSGERHVDTVVLRSKPGSPGTWSAASWPPKTGNDLQGWDEIRTTVAVARVYFKLPSQERARLDSLARQVKP